MRQKYSESPFEGVADGDSFRTFDACSVATKARTVPDFSCAGRAGVPNSGTVAWPRSAVAIYVMPRVLPQRIVGIVKMEARVHDDYCHGAAATGVRP